MESKDEQKLFTTLGKRITDLRKQRKFSQEQLAAETGLDRVAIGYLEQGRRKPTVRTLHRIAKGLGTTLEELLKGF